MKNFFQEPDDSWEDDDDDGRGNAGCPAGCCPCVQPGGINDPNRGGNGVNDPNRGGNGGDNGGGNGGGNGGDKGGGNGGDNGGDNGGGNGGDKGGDGGRRNSDLERFKDAPIVVIKNENCPELCCPCPQGRKDGQ